MLSDVGLERGRTRWRVFKRSVARVDKKALRGPVLDLGCGRGEFVCAALNDGVQAHGIDVNYSGIERFRNHVSEDWKTACACYDGENFPYDAKSISAIHCWFVFEHLEKPHEMVAEISRIANDACVFVLNAQDGRTQYDAHGKMPWLPFMSHTLKRAWLDELVSAERRDYILENLYPTTAGEVLSLLKFFGWRVWSFNLTDAVAEPLISYPSNVDEARLAAREARRLFDGGIWPSAPMNYSIVAVPGHHSVRSLISRQRSFVRRAVGNLPFSSGWPRTPR